MTWIKDMVAMWTMQIVWILYAVVSHLLSTIDNLMNHCNSGSLFLFNCVSNTDSSSILLRSSHARKQRHPEIKRAAHWLSWWKIEIILSYLLHPFSRSLTLIVRFFSLHKNCVPCRFSYKTHYRESVCKSKIESKTNVHFGKSFMWYAHEFR